MHLMFHNLSLFHFIFFFLLPSPPSNTQWNGMKTHFRVSLLPHSGSVTHLYSQLSDDRQKIMTQSQTQYSTDIPIWEPCQQSLESFQDRKRTYAFRVFAAQPQSRHSFAASTLFVYLSYTVPSGYNTFIIVVLASTTPIMDAFMHNLCWSLVSEIGVRCRTVNEWNLVIGLA